jgi:hypothetical protein
VPKQPGGVASVDKVGGPYAVTVWLVTAVQALALVSTTRRTPEAAVQFTTAVVLVGVPPLTIAPPVIDQEYVPAVLLTE